MTNNIFMVFVPEHFSSPKLRFTDVWKMSTRGTKHSGIKISRLLVGWLGVDLVFSEALDNDWEAFSLLLNRRSDDFVTLEVARVSKVSIRGEEVDLSLPASDVVIGFSLTLSLIGVTPGGKLLTVFRPDSDVIELAAELTCWSTTVASLGGDIVIDKAKSSSSENGFEDELFGKLLKSILGHFDDTKYFLHAIINV